MAAEMTEEEIQAWTRVRARGKWRFIVLRGALVGIAAVLVIVAGEIYLHSYLHFDMIPFAILAYVLGGVPFGWLEWGSMERKYRRSDVGPRCQKCGYSLCQATSENCPECGASHDGGDRAGKEVAVKLPESRG